MEYEVGKQPGPPTRSRIEVDPITPESSAAPSTPSPRRWPALFRMSYSSIIRESEDLGAGIFDAEGRELCESDSTPMHIGSLPWYIRGFMHIRREIEEGDVIVHNHPYLGASHTPDVAVAVPIFWEGEHSLCRRDGACPGRGRFVPRHQRRRLRRLRRAKLYNGLRWYQRGSSTATSTG